MDLPDIKLIQAHWKLHLLDNKEMVNVATDALAAGRQGKAILELAAGLVEYPDMYEEIHTTFGKALIELGADPISEEEAGLYLSKNIAAKIVSGEIEPEAGAGEIDSIITWHWEDEISDWPEWSRGWYEITDRYRDKPCELRKEIIKEAEKLLEIEQ